LNWCQPHVNGHFEVMNTNQSATSPIDQIAPQAIDLLSCHACASQPRLRARPLLH
jgi:hypothetical protein